MKIFLAATSLLPAYGGPAYSVSQLALSLADTGAAIGLWAADQSVLCTPLLPPRTKVRRFPGTLSAALAKFGKVDVLHDNGIWLPHNHRIAVLAARYRIPRVVSTRGMLEPWAVRHKRWRKDIAWWFYQRRDLRCAQLLHTTAAKEAENLERLELAGSICVIPNGIDLPDIHSETAGGPAERVRDGACGTALFLGRIHPVKGLPMLVEAWARLRPAGWRLQIAGPDEAGHRAEVEKAISTKGISDVVSFLGPLAGDAKHSAFSAANLFILPTYSESFGMVVGEALAHGIPVLTTTGAPWSVLRDRNCGWWVEPTIDGIASGLRQATSLDSETLRLMGARGRDLIAQEFGWDYIAQQFIRIYDKLLHAPPLHSYANQ